MLLERGEVMKEKTKDNQSKGTQSTQSTQYSQSKKNNKFNALLAGLACLLTSGLVIFSAYANLGYDLEIGLPSDRRIMADRRVENIVATEENRRLAQEAAYRLEPVRERDERVRDWIEIDIEEFFQDADRLRAEWVIFNTAPPPIEPDSNIDSADNVDFDENYAEDIPVPVVPDQRDFAFRIPMSSTSSEILLTMDAGAFIEFQNKVYEVVGATLERGIVNVGEIELHALRTEINNLDINADTRELSFEIISTFLRPNLIENEEETAAARERRAQEYEVIYFLQGQTIVDQGAIVSEEAFAVLNELGLLRSASETNIIPEIGLIGIVIAAFAIIISYFKLFYKNLDTFGRKEGLVLFTIYLITVFVTLGVSSLPYFAVPILVATLLIAILINGELALILNLFITVICALIYGGDIRFLLFFIITGSFIALLSTYTTERSKIIFAGIISSFINFSVAIIVMFVFDRRYQLDSLYFALGSGAMGMVSVVLAMGTLPIWEVTFGIITPIKLLDLANPNNPLLRRLTIEAPGTYHHSLIVANLSETAAYDIGANPSLARVGAYYHDVGKLKHPGYFFENQVGPNPHDDMNPRSSVHVIISHITFGLQLASEYRMPNQVKDIIAQHHGNTLIKFFYFKAKSQSGDEEIPVDDYRYNFPKPQTKEAAIVMLADTVEAAVRSKLNTVKDSSEIEAFVRELVKDKQDDGQLSECPLTLKDMEIIINSFLRVFRGMYHERIPYPKQEDTSDKK